MTGQKIYAGIVTGIVAVGIVVIATIEITGTGDTPGGVPCIPGIPFQITTEESRYLPFHSAQRPLAGKLPTW